MQGPKMSFFLNFPYLPPCILVGNDAFHYAFIPPSITILKVLLCFYMYIYFFASECCSMSRDLCACVNHNFNLSPFCVIHTQVVPTSYHHKYCCSEHLHTCPLLKLCNRSVGYTHLERESLGHGLSCPEFDQTVPHACPQ